MPKTITYNNTPTPVKNESLQLTNSTFELVNWPALSPSKRSESTSPQVNDKVLALQTTRHALSCKSPLPKIDRSLASKKLPFDAFNLGFHVGDSVEQVTHNRYVLELLINQQQQEKTLLSENKENTETKIQWLEQVHGNEVVEITFVSEQAITADASITRQKNIALAIMTADCLPILLSNKNGTEIGAIHGGWRPLAANIIAKTLKKMHSKPNEIVAWLGPCIGNKAFEVGKEVKEAFTQQDIAFTKAFLKQKDGKYLADLQLIAQLQLQAFGVSTISTLDECTYHETKKYYSYRKEKITGRMASLVCRR